MILKICLKKEAWHFRICIITCRTHVRNYRILYVWINNFTFKQSVFSVPNEKSYDYFLKYEINNYKSIMKSSCMTDQYIFIYIYIYIYIYIKLYTYTHTHTHTSPSSSSLSSLSSTLKISFDILYFSSVWN